MKSFQDRVAEILVAISVPVILSGLSILILLSPLYINLEYRRPGFPADRYGFSTSQRLEYGNLTRRYLISGQDLDTLRELRFDSGEPLYLDRELDHLLDVKIVLQGVYVVFGIAIVILVLGSVYSNWKGWKAFLPAISNGGRLTTFLLIALLLFTAVSFRALFTNFHLIFFEGDSWLFNYSDTLIRLFPMQFWQDAFIVFGLITLIGGVLLGWVVPLRKDNG